MKRKVKFNDGQEIRLSSLEKCDGCKFLEVERHIFDDNEYFCGRYQVVICYNKKRCISCQEEGVYSEGWQVE